MVACSKAFLEIWKTDEILRLENVFIHIGMKRWLSSSNKQLQVLFNHHIMMHPMYLPSSLNPLLVTDGVTRSNWNS